MAAGTVILICGALALRPDQGFGDRPGHDPNTGTDTDTGINPDTGDGVDETTEVGWSQFCLWLLLSGCAVVLLMAVTNKLCLDVASLPFLWIFPLGLYLISFILCFGAERFYSRPLWIGVAATGLLIQYGVASFLPSAKTGGPLFGSLPAQILFFS
ncbi:MAG TPA: hypothetical protein EYQ54_19680, partial [Myxococcales bacterium]|nr:hypothetical protein [Myxococcales bacterium]